MTNVATLLAEFKFVGKISKVKNNKVMWIPEEFYNQIIDLEVKQVRIIIDDKYRYELFY
jgi:dTDP-4-dehydrorhamnose 3,5-epimerase-like enzyme